MQWGTLLHGRFIFSLSPHEQRVVIPVFFLSLAQGIHTQFVGIYIGTELSETYRGSYPGRCFHLPYSLYKCALAIVVGIPEFVGIHIGLRISQDWSDHVPEHAAEFPENHLPVDITFELCGGDGCQCTVTFPLKRPAFPLGGCLADLFGIFRCYRKFLLLVIPVLPDIVAHSVKFRLIDLADGLLPQAFVKLGGLIQSGALFGIQCLPPACGLVVLAP